MLKGAVLLVAALALVEGASLSREFGCTRGVEYWCSSPEAAEECGATEYCNEYVWLVKQFTELEEDVGDSSMTCAACEWVADQALKMLEKESTEEEILTVLEGLCDKIPMVGAECHKYVAEMGPTVIKMLEGMVSADKICQTLRLCTVMENFDAQNDFVKFILGPQLGDDKCTMCVDGLKELQVILKDQKMLDVIEATTTLFCANFPLPQCQELMEQYTKQYIEMALGWDARAQCVKMKSCTSHTELVIEDNLTEVVEDVAVIADTPECDACIDGVKELKKVWADESTQAMVKILVDEICTLLSVPESTCSLVSQLVLPQITAAINALDPKDTCVKIGACTAGLSDEPFPCMFCQFMGEQALKILFNERTEAIMIATAKEACSVLPMFSQECKDAVDKYGEAFLDQINHTDFYFLCRPLCDKLYLCDPEVQQWIKNLSLYKAITSEGTEECDACMDGIDEIKEIFTDPDTQDLMHLAIEAMCDSLHPKIPTCERVLKMAFDGFLMQLAKVDNHEICAQYGMCPSDELTAVTDVLVAVTDDSFTCEYCEFIGNQFIRRVFNNETETIILGYAKEICTKLPSFIGNECSALVDEYGFYYLGELKKVLDIEHFCEKFHMCTPAGKLFLETSSIVKVLTGEEAVGGELLCDACDKGLMYALNYLKGPTGQLYLREFGIGVCYMYGEDPDVCEAIVTSLLEGLNKELDSFDPKIACVAFNMCPEPVYPMEETFVLAKETFPCDICTFVGDEFVERVLTYDTVTKILGVARKACAYVPLFSEECTSYIDDEGEDQIYKWINRININQLCTKLHLCHGNNSISTLPPLPDQLEGFICDTCEFFGHEFIDRLLTNDTIKATLDVARKVCSAVPLYSQECISFIDSQGFYWMNLWISELNVDRFCSKVTLCPAQNETVVEVTEMGPVAASIQCDTCMFIGNEFVEKAFTEENIQMTLGLAKMICAKVPVFSKECSDFIDSDGNELIHTLISYVHVDKICAMIHACPAKALDDIFPDPDHGFICDTCEFFGHEFIQRLLTKETRKKTLAIARKGCSYVPLYSAECEKFIDDDGDYFLQVWISSLNVDRFCSKIQLCDKPYAEESLAESLGLTASIQCDVCMFVGNEFVEKALTDDTIGFTLMLAHEMCSYVPLFAKECMEAVEQDGEKLIRMAFSHFHPDWICREIHLCPAALEESLPNPNQGFVCDTCEFFGHEFVERVLTKEARSKTLDVVRVVCSYVPLYAEECKAVVDEHGSYYLNMWIDMMDMDGLCQKLQLCNPLFKTWYETSAIPQLIKKAKMPDCNTCVEGFDELKKILHDPYTKDLVAALTREACLSLPIPFCNSVMTRVVAHIETAVDAIDSKGECTKLGQCPGATETEELFNVLMTSLVPVSEGMCDDCVEGFERVKKILHDPYTKETLHVFVHDLCDGVDHIPGCQMILNPFVDWLVQVEIDSKAMCTFFGACAKPKVVVEVSSDFCDSCVEGIDEMKEVLTDPTIRMALKVMAEEFCTYAPMPATMCKYGMDSFVDSLLDSLAKVDSKGTCSFFGVCSALGGFPADGICETCVEGFEELKEMMADPEVKMVLKSMAGEACKTLPIPMCQYILDSYIDTMISSVASIDSNSTCAFMGACEGEWHTAGDIIKSAFPEVSAGPCDLCTSSVDELKEMVSDPAVIEVVKEAVDDVCAMLPIMADTCKTSLETYIDEAVDVVVKMDTKTICMVMGMC